MTTQWQAPLTDIRDFLRAHLADPRPERAAEGKNWVFDDFPREDLGMSSYPRVSVVRVSDVARPNGSRFQLFDRVWSGQVDVWVKPDQQVGDKANVRLAEAIADAVERALQERFSTTLFPRYSSFSIDRVSTPLWDEERQVWRVTLTATLQFGSPVETIP